jgi:hypothetical protein
MATPDSGSFPELKIGSRALYLDNGMFRRDAIA